MWPPLVTGVWKSGQSVKEEPLYLMPFVNIQSPFKVEIATSDEAQEQRLYGETDAKGITVKLETPYMEEYNVLRRTPQIEIRI